MRSSAPATTARRDPTWYILYPPFSFSAALSEACRVPRPVPALSRDRQNTALCSARTAIPASLCHFFHAEYLRCRTTLGYLLYLDGRGRASPTRHRTASPMREAPNTSKDICWLDMAEGDKLGGTVCAVLSPATSSTMPVRGSSKLATLVAGPRSGSLDDSFKAFSTLRSFHCRT